MTQNITEAVFINMAEYRKTATIKAVQIAIDFAIDTLEGTFTGKPGDWLAEGIAGERYIIDDEIFQKTCVRVVNGPREEPTICPLHSDIKNPTIKTLPEVLGTLKIPAMVIEYRWGCKNE